MLERLRQVAFMVEDLEAGRELYGQALGMEVCYTEDLSEYQLENLVLPAGNGTFVELLQPTSTESAGARFLKRRGEGAYLLIFETNQYDQLLDHLKSLEVRIINETQEEFQRSAFIHPSSANGAFLEVIRGIQRQQSVACWRARLAKNGASAPYPTATPGRSAGA